jgi:hypothetical protein
MSGLAHERLSGIDERQRPTTMPVTAASEATPDGA